MHNWLTALSRTINSKQSNSIVLTGNIYDLFYDGNTYTPIIPFLINKYKNISTVTYQANGNISVKNIEILKDQEKILSDCKGNQLASLEFLRTISNSCKQVLIIIEMPELLIPEGNIASLSSLDRMKIALMQNWFNDPIFTSGNSSVILISETKTSINERVSKLPQFIEISIPSPDKDNRKFFIDWFESSKNLSIPIKEEIIAGTAGLSIHAVQQLLNDITYENISDDLIRSKIICKVEEYIKSQLGEDVVEFKKPKHNLDNVVGYSNLKNFIRNELIPSFKSTDGTGLSGITVAGPIGSGKTFIFEAVATELDMVYLNLKNIRSQWYGTTDVIINRLYRILVALDKACISVDEADTQFGKIKEDGHETEKRLVGKIQQIMSDDNLKGKIIWILMTARVHLLSADIRRPGRAGDLIIPVLDPTSHEDRVDFCNWIIPKDLNLKSIDKILELTKNYSSAAYASIKARIKSNKCKTEEEILSIINDTLFADIQEERRYQELQALVNCTRFSLLKETEGIQKLLGDTSSIFSVKVNEVKNKWREEINYLESKGIR